MECHCIYIESSHNVIADALSRLDLNTFWYFKPNAYINMTTPSNIKYYGQAVYWLIIQQTILSVS